MLTAYLLGKSAESYVSIQIDNTPEGNALLKAFLQVAMDATMDALKTKSDSFEDLARFYVSLGESITEMEAYEPDDE